MQYIGNNPPQNIAYLPEVSVQDNLLDEWISDGTTDVATLDISSLSPEDADNLLVIINGEYNITTMEHNDSTETYQCVFTRTISTGATVAGELFPYIAVNQSSRGGDVVANVALGRCSGGSWYMNWQSFENHFRVGTGQEIYQWNVISEACVPNKPTSLKFFHNKNVAGTTVFPAGFSVKVYRRDMESKQVVYTPQNGDIQKNYLHNTGNLVNQRGYVYGSAATAVSQGLTDRWLANTIGASISYSTASDQELMTIAGGIYQGLERNDLSGKVCVLHWEGTAQASLWRINGNAANFQDSPIVFTMPTGVGGDGEMEYVVFGAGTLKHMKLELGEAPTKWEPEDPAQQAIICDRYFERIYAGWGGSVTNTTAYVAPIAFRNTMRITPTLGNTIAIDYSNFNTTSPVFFSGRDTGGLMSKIAIGTGVGYWGFELDFSAEIL